MMMKVLVYALFVGVIPVQAQQTNSHTSEAPSRDLKSAPAAMVQRKTDALTLKLTRRPLSAAAVPQRKTDVLERKLRQRVRSRGN